MTYWFKGLYEHTERLTSVQNGINECMAQGFC